MSKPKRSSVQRYHDRVAPRYDHSYDDTFWEWHNTLTWEYLRTHLPRDMAGQVLDVGCGTGTWAAKLIKSGFRVTCLDVSHRMLEQARRKIDEQGGTARAAFVQADLGDLSGLEAGAYALAIALGDPIGCTPVPARALKQIRRVLAQDGILVATFDNRLAAIEYYLQAGDPGALRRFLRDGKTHWLTRDVEEQFPIATFTPGGVRALMSAAGYDVLDMVGKTVLPMRHYRELLAEPKTRRELAKIERTLCRDPDAMGRASHIQVASRVKAL